MDEQLRTVDAPFARVGRDEYGYSSRQVDAFLDRARQHYDDVDSTEPALTSRDVRAKAFDAAAGGYDVRAVDAAMDRLEDALARQERDRLIDDKGEQAWLRRIGKASTVLRARLHRPETQRFRRPRKKHASSYDVDEVDAFCRRLLAYFEEHEPLSVDAVRRIEFEPVSGRDGYEETQVDAFLDRVVELMAEID